MLRLHKDHTDTKIAQAGLVEKGLGIDVGCFATLMDSLLMYPVAGAGLVLKMSPCRQNFTQ